MADIDLNALRTILIWSLVVNYLVLLVWFGAIALAHDRVFSLHSRWFALSRETFDALHYGGMAVYKIGTLLLNVAPLVGVLMLT